ncbi:MAG: hypothetical protein WA746_03710, partial [Isosphaeraceae bacterium]
MTHDQTGACLCHRLAALPLIAAIRLHLALLIPHLAPRHLELTLRHLAFVICHLPFVICHPASAIRHLASVIRHLPSVIRHLTLAIRLFAFPIPRSEFLLPHFPKGFQRSQQPDEADDFQIIPGGFAVQKVQYFGPASEQPSATFGAFFEAAHDHRRVVIRGRIRVTRPYRGLKKQLAAEVVNPAELFRADRVRPRPGGHSDPVGQVGHPDPLGAIELP